MKKSLLIAALIALSASGCAVTPPTAAQLTQVCENTQATVLALRSMQTLPVDVQANLDVIGPIVTGACSVGTIDITNLATFNKTVLPALQKAVDAGVTDAAKHDQLVGLILAAQVIVNNMSVGL